MTGAMLVMLILMAMAISVVFVIVYHWLGSFLKKGGWLESSYDVELCALSIIF